MPLHTDPKENMKALIAALRSGEYKQGTRTLCADGQYCCMGVAADLAVKNGVGEWLKPPHDSNRHAYLREPGYIPLRAFLPVPVLQMYGLTDDDAWSFVHLNDSGKYTFTQIADLMERKYINGEEINVYELAEKATTAPLSA